VCSRLRAFQRSDAQGQRNTAGGSTGSATPGGDGVQCARRSVQRVHRELPCVHGSVRTPGQLATRAAVPACMHGGAVRVLLANSAQETCPLAHAACRDPERRQGDS
jgi:hypothetical protein